MKTRKNQASCCASCKFNSLGFCRKNQEMVSSSDWCNAGRKK